MSIVSRLIYIAIRMTQPGDVVIELHIATGYFQQRSKENAQGEIVQVDEFIQTGEQHHVMIDAEGKAIFNTTATAGLTRLEDVRAELSDYLLAQGIIPSALVA